MKWNRIERVERDDYTIGFKLNFATCSTVLS